MASFQSQGLSVPFHIFPNRAETGSASSSAANSKNSGGSWSVPAALPVFSALSARVTSAILGAESAALARASETRLAG